MPRFPRPAMAAHLEAICPQGVTGDRPAFDHASDRPPNAGERPAPVYPVSGELHLSREEDLMLRYGNLFAHVIGPCGEKRGA